MGLGLLVVLLAGGVAFADDDPEALIKLGVTLRRRGEDVKAHGYFQRAYDLSHTPRSAAQLGLSNMALAKWLDAETRLSEALGTSIPDPWVDSHRETLEKSRTAARTHLGGVEIEGAPPEAAVEVGDRAAVRLPADATVWIEPGSVRLRVTAPGFRPGTQEVSVAAGAKTKARVTLARVEPEGSAAASGRTGVPAGDGAATGQRSEPAGKIGVTPPADRDEGGADGQAGRRKLRIAGIVAGGVGVGAVAAGFIFRSMASTKIQNIRDDGANNRPYNPANGNYQTLDRASVGMFIGGGVAAVGGALLFVLNRESSASGASSSESTVSLGPGPGDAGLMLAGRF